jgi:triosephosphate isomerase
VTVIDETVIGGREVWIGTSWKMTKTLGEACEYADGLAAGGVPAGVQAFVLPAYTALAAVGDRLAAAPGVLVGAQNAHFAAEGASTGEVSMRMVKDAGARLVAIGHAERRREFGETDRTVALKARAALDHGLIPLLCVGEPREVRDRGRADAFVVAQLRAGTGLLAPGELDRVLVAYEPVWAIGTGGSPATPAEVAPVMAAARRALAARAAGGRCRAVLYGGSVTPGNAAELLRQPEVDGLFVGRAAWRLDGFQALLRIGAEVGSGSRAAEAGITDV